MSDTWRIWIDTVVMMMMTSLTCEA